MRVPAKWENYTTAAVKQRLWSVLWKVECWLQDAHPSASPRVGQSKHPKGTMPSAFIGRFNKYLAYLLSSRTPIQTPLPYNSSRCIMKTSLGCLLRAWEERHGKDSQLTPPSSPVLLIWKEYNLIERLFYVSPIWPWFSLHRKQDTDCLIDTSSTFLPCRMQSHSANQVLCNYKWGKDVYGIYYK